jgi:hypothetical protein
MLVYLDLVWMYYISWNIHEFSNTPFLPIQARSGLNFNSPFFLEILRVHSARNNRSFFQINMAVEVIDKNVWVM